MIYEFVQYQLPLSDLERDYNFHIRKNEVYGTWIRPFQEFASDWMAYEEPEQYFCDVCGHNYDVDYPCEFH